MTTFIERIRSSSRRHKSRVVLALDSSEPYDRRLAHAEAVLGATKQKIAAVKVNQHLLLPFGLQGIRGVIQASREEGLPLIADLKINDVESTNLNIVDSLFAYGFDAVIANPFVGRQEGLGRVVERVHEREGGILFLVYMSHKGAEEGFSLRLEGGAPMYALFAERARDWNADGVIVSAKSKEKIAVARKIVGEKRLIFAPGVGAQGGDAKVGVTSGADFVIIGRSVMEASDPERAVAEFSP